MTVSNNNREDWRQRAYPGVELLFSQSVLDAKQIEGLSRAVTDHVPLLQPRAGPGWLLLHRSRLELEDTFDWQAGLFDDLWGEKAHWYWYWSRLSCLAQVQTAPVVRPWLKTPDRPQTSDKGESHVCLQTKQTSDLPLICQLIWYLGSWVEIQYLQYIT